MRQRVLQAQKAEDRTQAEGRRQAGQQLSAVPRQSRPKRYSASDVVAMRTSGASMHSGLVPQTTL